MGRAPCCDKANVKKGPWSPEEDAKLKEFIEKFGTGGNWIALPQKAGLKRCGKSCRLRWLNYLRPNIKHGEFSDEEDRIICTLYSSIGSRWSIIAAQLPGRTDNDIKNYWNTKLKKKLMGMIPANQGKFSSLFSGHFQTSATQSTLSQFYNSFYTKSLTTIDQSLSSPQNFLYNPPLFQSSYNYQQNQEGLMDLQYNNNNNNYSVKEQSMLVFGGNDQASCSSSDGSLISNGFEENQKFMLQYGKNLMNEDPLNSLFLDQKANGVMANNQLQYDLEEVKQLITSGNNFLFNDENKIHERGMYYY